MKISLDGQLEIPADIRKDLDLQPGTEVEFQVIENSLIIRKKSNHSKGQQLIQLMRGTATASLSTNDIINMTRHPND